MANQNNVEIRITGKDELSTPVQHSTLSLQLLEQVVVNLGKRFEATGLNQKQLAMAIAEAERTLAAFGVTVNASGQAVDKLGGVLGQVATSRLRDLNTELAGAKDRLAELQQWGVNASTGMERLGTSFGNVTGLLGTLGITLSAAGLVGFGRTVLETATRMEQLRATLNAVSGGTLQGVRNFGFLTETGQRLGVQVDSMVRDFVALTAATRGTELQGENTKRIFEAVAIAGRSTGASNAQLHGAFVALEQMISKGVVSMEELRRQLGNAIPGAFETAARAMGMTTQQLNDFVKTGEANAIPFVLRFAMQLRREYADGIEQATNTAQTAFTRLENAWTLLKERIGRSGPLQLAVRVATAGIEIFGGTQQEEQRIREAVAQRFGPAARGARPEERAEMERLERLRALGMTTAQPAEFGETVRRLFQGESVNQPIELMQQRLREQVEARRREQRELTREMEQTDLRMQEREVRRVEDAEARRKIQGIVTETAKQLSDLDRLAQIAPERLGKTSDQAAQQVALLNERLKIELEQLDKLARASLTTPLTHAQQQEMATRRNSILLIESQIHAIEELERDKQEAVRMDEQRSSILAKLDRQEAKAALSREEAEAAALRAEIQEKRLGSAFEATAMARLQAAQEARFAQELAVAQAKEEQALLEAEAKFILKQQEDLTTAYDARMARQDAIVIKLREELELLRAPRAERPEIRARQQVLAIPEIDPQRGELERLAAEFPGVRQAAESAKRMEAIYRQLGRGIAQAFDAMWEDIFSIGETKGKNFGLSLVQNLQRMFSSLTISLLNQILNSLAGTSSKEGGWQAALAQAAVRIGVSLFTPTPSVPDTSAGAEVGAGIFMARGGTIPAINTMAQAGLRIRRAAYGMQPLSAVAFQHGGIAPSLDMMMLSSALRDALAQGTASPALYGYQAGGIVPALSHAVIAMQAGGIVPALSREIIREQMRDMGSGGFSPLAMQAGGIVRQPSFALIGEQPGRFEAVVPLPDNRAIPVAFTGQPPHLAMASPPVVIELHQDFTGAIDPRTLRTSRQEVLSWTIDGVNKDGPLRRVIRQNTR